MSDIPIVYDMLVILLNHGHVIHATCHTAHMTYEDDLVGISTHSDKLVVRAHAVFKTACVLLTLQDRLDQGSPYTIPFTFDEIEHSSKLEKKDEAWHLTVRQRHDSLSAADTSPTD